MEFTKAILEIDPEETALRIEKFIRHTVKSTYHAKGIVIGLSGGVDSAVAGALSARAIGAERVCGLLLPERDSSPLSRVYALEAASSLGIPHEEIDISPILESFDVYGKRDAIVQRMFPELDGPYRFRLVLPQDLLDRDRLNVYYLEVLKDDGSVLRARLPHNAYRELMAANDIKQRTRMIQLYYEAEKRGYVVCGTTNYSETVQGFFVKYGDGGVDIEPLAELYKSQVYQLARYLGVPDSIIARAPSPDTYSYAVSDEEFYFCMPYDLVDHIIYAIDHDVPRGRVADEFGLSAEQVDRAWRELERRRKLTEHLRMLPPTPGIER